jgi:hypothetical protein
MIYLRPQAHWSDTVRPLLDALAPRGVWTDGEDELCELVRGDGERQGFQLVSAPGETTDLVVVSGDPNHHVTSEALERALADGVGGEDGPPVLIVAGTGWPFGDRDGYVDPELIPSDRRRAYAHCLPDPDEAWLSAEQTSIAAALEPGGASNGVRPAVEAVLACGGWMAHFLEGFGGLAVLAPEIRLGADSALHDVWDRLGQSESAQQLLREMDLELGRMRLAQARLKAVVAQEEATNRQLRLRLGPVLKELDQRLDNESASVERLHDNLDQVNAAMLAAVQRAQTLEQRATEAEARATAARRELTEERTWVAKQARLLAGSQAWRLGHGMARTARLLTFRRHRGTDSVQRIIARMEDGLGTHGSSGRDK